RPGLRCSVLTRADPGQWADRPASMERIISRRCANSDPSTLSCFAPSISLIACSRSWISSLALPFDSDFEVLAEVSQFFRGLLRHVLRGLPSALRDRLRRRDGVRARRVTGGLRRASVHSPLPER